MTFNRRGSARSMYVPAELSNSNIGVLRLWKPFLSVTSRLQSCVGNLHVNLKIIFKFYVSTFDCSHNHRMLRKQKNNEKLKMQFSCYFSGHKNLSDICLHSAICSMNMLETINQQTPLTVGILFLPISLSTSSAKILILYGKGI